jgi:predicted nicotinamide N-methyase
MDSADLAGKKVLELGCGCGLAGIAVGLQGAEVTVTDIEPDALVLAEENWKRNDLSPASVEELDWCRPTLQERFDYILAADVLYDPKFFPDLIRSSSDLLSEEGTLLLSEPGRPQAHAFFAGMLQKGYRSTSTHYSVNVHNENFEICVSELF